MKKLLVAITFIISTACFQYQAQAQDEVDAEMLEFMMDFTDKLALLVQDYSTNFTNTVGEIIPNENENSTLVDYSSKVNLPEAIESYFTRSINQEDLTYVGVFAETQNPDEAYDIYSGVSFLVEVGTYACCEFETTVMEGEEESYLARTVFVPKVNSGFSEAFNKMNLSVSVYSSFDIDEDLNVIDLYLVVLNINEQWE